MSGDVPAAKRIAHPDLGLLTFAVDSVAVPHEPEQRLVVYTAPPDSPTARVLPLLARRDLGAPDHEG